jgi:uncharacterized delta-60 repeat protein
MIALRRSVFSLTLAFGLARLWAQEGSVDLTFNPSDVGYGGGDGPGDGPSDHVYATTLLSNGKILIAGDFNTYNTTIANCVARLNTNGSLDTTFTVGAGANNRVYAMAVQIDSRILIAGAFTSFNGVARNRVARLNVDGSLDTSFDPGTGADNTIRGLAVQPDGKILLVGEFSQYNGTSRNRVVRVNADGTLDTSFDPGTGANDVIHTVAVQADNKILVGGEFTNFNGTVRHFLARLNTGGSLDMSFITGYGPNADVYAMLVQSDGKILIGGWFLTYNGTSRRGIARINTDGSLDASFAPGTGVSGVVRSVTRRSNGKVIIGGEFLTFNGVDRTGIAQLNADGSLDMSFNYNRWITWNVAVLAFAVQTDGKVIVGHWMGSAYTGNRSLMRLNTDGTLDTAFDRGYGADELIKSVAQQADGKILIGGGFSRYAGSVNNRIARLTINGTLDASFITGNGANNPIEAMAVQPDGKILIAGWFTTYDGIAAQRIARLNTNGSLDAGFSSSVGADGYSLSTTIYAIALQPDGKILIGGNFTTYGGSARRNVARLNADGTLDTGFDPGTGTNTAINSMSLQPDGKVLVGGYFQNLNGFTCNNIARLNANGTFDTSFDPGTGPNGKVSSIAVQPNGKILIGGFFTSVNGIGRHYLARLNTNGTVDLDFDPGTGPNHTIDCITVRPDGQILIGGGFTYYNGVARRLLARLNQNGSLDMVFDTGAGVGTGGVYAIAQSTDKILIGGSFISFNNVGRDRIARITDTPRAAIRVMLEGPYSSGLMNDALRTLPSFPLTEPFTAMGYAESAFVSGASIAASVLAVTGNNAIVDWVIVEMRPVATPGTVAASHAVLLQRDGDIVDLDGVSTVGFAGLAPGNYCVAVKPRTHLPVMLSPATPIAYGSGNVTVDLTLAATQVYDNDARKNVGGVMVLAQGDATFNEALKYTGAGNDRDPILVRVGGITPTNSISGYYPEDVNMDGVVKYTGANNDRDPILVNIGGITPTNTRVATLP